MVKGKGVKMDNTDKWELMAMLSRLLETPVTDVLYKTETLKGGTVGDVRRITGRAYSNNIALPFDIVKKTQHKWERYGDPLCWRREYEIYKNGLTEKMPCGIKLPRLVHLNEEVNQTIIWMEYVNGDTGNIKLNAPELTLAAERLGRFQAEFHLKGNKDLLYLRDFPAVRTSFELWFGRMAKPLSESIESFPEKIRQSLLTYAENADKILNALNALPVTLCQGDVHHDNLILKKEKGDTTVYLIDWDSAGYGIMGEDAVDVLMEAFVYSDRDVSLLPDFKKRIINGYINGAISGGVNLYLDDSTVRNIFALAWGFRIADLFLYYKEEHPKKRCIGILEAMLL